MEISRIIRVMKDEEKTVILSKLCCDVLRALTILHGNAWRSDLALTLEGLWDLQGLTLDEVDGLKDKLYDALKLLKEREIVFTEKRVRASLRPPHSRDEMFHYTRAFFTLLREFGSDIYVMRYRKEIMGYR